MGAEAILYHYCSAPTGFAILKNRVFRLSALSAANDSLEGRVLGREFSSLLKEAGLPQGLADVASVIVEGYADSTEGFALCLSEKGDLLSQWRAYARDATGIAIGFSPEVLRADFGPVNFGSQFFELCKVGYGVDGLHASLKPVVDTLVAEFAGLGEFVRLGQDISREYALHALADRKSDVRGLFRASTPESEKYLKNLLDCLAPLHFQIYGTKPDSFHEEAEWRLLRYRHRVALPEVEFFADDHAIKPFIECLIADPARGAIREVILGPKHRSNANWFRAFLASVGLGEVEVKRSAITSYR